MSQQALSWAAACLFRRAAQRLTGVSAVVEIERDCLWQCHKAALAIGVRSISGAALPGSTGQPPAHSRAYQPWPSRTSRGISTSAALQARDYYDVLGVSKSVSETDLKKAFHQLAKKYHPDANPGDQSAQKKFQEVAQAYETLKDPQKRRIYDQVGPEGMDQMGDQGSPGGSPFEGGFNFHSGGFSASFGSGSSEDIFKAFFGGGHGFADMFEQAQRQQQQQQGQDLQMQASISFMEAAKGVRKSFSFGGTNYGGTFIPRKSVDVDIPAGVETGTMLRVPGSGMPAPGKNGRAGSLMLELHVAQHPIFRRNKADIHQDLEVDFVDMILGATLRVPTLEQHANVTIQPGTQDGKQIRLRQQGMKMLNRIGKGDMIIHVKCVLPARVSERQRQLLLDFVEEEKLTTAA